MTRSRTSRRGSKWGHAHRDLWTSRPMSGCTPSAKVKRICRKIERAQAKRRKEEE